MNLLRWLRHRFCHITAGTLEESPRSSGPKGREAVAQPNRQRQCWLCGNWVDRWIVALGGKFVCDACDGKIKRNRHVGKCVAEGLKAMDAKQGG